MIFEKNGIMKLVAFQSLINGLWLLFHKGKQNYTSEIRGFKHMEFLNSWIFCIAVIVLAVGLLYAAYKNKSSLQRWLLILLNTMWSFYTVILLINELSGVPNMSWALFLGYNVAIFMSARYEVVSE